MSPQPMSAETTSATASEAAAPEEKTAQVRALLVDDVATNRLLGRKILQRAGIEVVEAVDGKDALDQFRAEAAGGQSFNMILMDLQMPVTDGYEATETLRSLGYEGPIIALSGSVMKEQKNRAMEGRLLGLHLEADRPRQTHRDPQGRPGPNRPVPLLTPSPPQDCGGPESPRGQSPIAAACFAGRPGQLECAVGDAHRESKGQKTQGEALPTGQLAEVVAAPVLAYCRICPPPPVASRVGGALAGPSSTAARRAARSLAALARAAPKALTIHLASLVLATVPATLLSDTLLSDTRPSGRAGPGPESVA